MKNTNNNLIAIYDFELFPYALGDVLTWNIRTAIRCEESNKEFVDIYICVDEKYPAGIYQRGLVNEDNYALFFNELYSAFGTHPRLGNIYIYRQREALLARLDEIASTDETNTEAISDYLGMLKHKVDNHLLSKIFHVIERKLKANIIIKKVIKRFVPTIIKKTVSNTLSHENALNDYFIKYIHSHEVINQFAAQRGRIPFLVPAQGCSPDIDELVAQKLKGKKIVTFHLRLRRLDAGYGGCHSYERDSDYLEWYDFLKEADVKHPNVIFIALGRLQEKPLEILRLPNVVSLRIYGMSLGHELTLMLRSDLFIGSSSGFAALANFSSIPYFITKMNPGSCHAYDIPEGTGSLPFAKENQKLIYAQETSQLLMSLLEQGVDLHSQDIHSDCGNVTCTAQSELSNVHDWMNKRSQPTHSAATTCRFYTSEKYCQEETAYLILPHLEKARTAYLNNSREDANVLLQRLAKNFPRLCRIMPQYLLLQGVIAVENKDVSLMQSCLLNLDAVESQEQIELLKSCLVSNLHNQLTPNVLDTLENLKSQISSSSFFGATL